MTRQSLLLLLSVVASFLAALMLLALLAGTSLAAAPPDAPDAPSATYTVRTPGDALLYAGCLAVAGPCTLRGALKLANDAAGSSEIHFDPSLDGTPIDLSNTLVITGTSILI